MMKDVIAKIGRGPKTAKDLTWDEAKQAMRALIEEQASPVQVGAFFVGMRMKGESVTELAALTVAAREYVRPLPVSTGGVVLDLPSYAGKQETFHAAIGAAIVAVAAGVPLLMHGHEEVPDRIQTAAVLEALGLPVGLSAEQVAEHIREKGFGYLDLALYHPPLAQLLGLYQALGLRTCIHQVARMLNPARAPVQVIGVTHPPYFEKTAEALRLLGSRRAVVLRGVEGEPELSISGVTRLLDMRDDRIWPLGLQPPDIGLPVHAPTSVPGFPSTHVQEEARLLHGVLHGDVRGSQRDWVVQNAALLLYAAGRTPSISAGVPVAQQLIDRGDAAKKYAELTSVRVRSGG